MTVKRIMKSASRLFSQCARVLWLSLVAAARGIWRAIVAYFSDPLLVFASTSLLFIIFHFSIEQAPPSLICADGEAASISETPLDLWLREFIAEPVAAVFDGATRALPLKDSACIDGNRVMAVFLFVNLFSLIRVLTDKALLEDLLTRASLTKKLMILAGVAFPASLFSEDHSSANSENAVGQQFVELNKRISEIEESKFGLNVQSLNSFSKKMEGALVEDSQGNFIRTKLPDSALAALNGVLDERLRDTERYIVREQFRIVNEAAISHVKGSPDPNFVRQLADARWEIKNLTTSYTEAMDKAERREAALLEIIGNIDMRNISDAVEPVMALNEKRLCIENARALRSPVKSIFFRFSPRKNLSDLQRRCPSPVNSVLVNRSSDEDGTMDDAAEVAVVNNR
ncbi:MAG: hypothetical protein AAGJ73_10265 [Pseudomonadota bacterium]